MSKTRASLGVIAVTAVTVATLFLLPFTPKLAVRTAVVKRGDLVKTALLEGVAAYQNERPVVSLQAGRVSQIVAARGQRVEAGQLLFRLDAAQEEEALRVLKAGRYQAKQTAAAYGEAAAFMAAQAWQEADKQEAALQTAIDLKQVRAEQGGVMGAVYCAEGDAVAAGAVLGLIRSPVMGVTAVCPASHDPKLGAAAVLRDAAGNRLGYARLTSLGAPVTDGQAGAVLPLGFETLAMDGTLTLGQRLTVELLCDSQLNQPLAPLEAFGEDQTLWVVENGAAREVAVSVGQRNGEYGCVPESLLGARVILLPDESKLSDGCPVKEAKER